MTHSETPPALKVCRKKGLLVWVKDTTPSSKPSSPLAIPSHVPSPIGSPVSPLNKVYRFKPIIEDNYEDTLAEIKELSVSVSSPSVTPEVRPRRNRTQTQTQPRLSILLTPPLLATDSRETPSSSLTPILAVLVEGYESCLRAVLRQDALVAAVNYTRHLSINSERIHCSESQPRSQGAYGDVWKGRLDRASSNARTVAVKRIRLKPQDGASNVGLLKALLKEVIPWCGLHHRNITPFIGYTFDDGHASLVSEWQANGHVFQHLSTYPHTNRLRMIAQVAEGLAYLHERNPSLIHGDIKPENVLVSKRGVAKLTDFGLSTILQSQSTGFLKTTHSFRGTIHYADPLLLNDRPITRFTDIWAFGWLAFGILTLQRPYDGVKPESQVILKILNYDVPSASTYLDLPHGGVIWPILQASWSRSNKERWSAGRIAWHIRQRMM